MSELHANIQLYSPGVDSYIGSYFLQSKGITDVKKVYFDIGHRYSYIEKELAKSQGAIVIEENYIGRYLEKPDAHVPNRNILFILLAQAFYDFYTDMTIWIGGLKDDMVNDNNSEFLNATNNLLKVMYPTRNIQVKSIFDYKLTKVEIVQWFRQAHPHRFKDLKTRTFSCYTPRSLYPVIENLQNDTSKYHCYSCNACFRRNVALYVGSGMDEKFFLPFYNKNLALEYETKARNGYYPPERNQAILQYVNQLREKNLL